MKYNGHLRSSADAGRTPLWEKHSRNPYFLVLIIALLLSAVCLYFWNKDRVEAKLRLTESLTEQAETELPGVAEELASTFRLYSDKWQSFVEDIEHAALNNVSKEYLSGLPSSLFTDGHMRNVWIFLERDEARGKQAFVINMERRGSETGMVYDQSIIQSEYYVAVRERNALKIRPVLRSEIDMNRLLGSGYSYNSAINERMTLIVDGPVMYKGDFAGIAGFEVELPDIRVRFFPATHLSAELLLIDSDGEVVVSPTESFVGEHYRNIQKTGYPDALTECALRVANGEKFDTFLSGRGSALTFAAFVPVDAGDGGRPWFLAALNDMRMVNKAGKVWLLVLFLVWFMAICLVLIIYEVRKRRALKAETEQAVAEMQPEAAAFFKNYERHRKACYVLCALLCWPAMSVLPMYEKRYRAALRDSDTKAAAKALSGMKKVTAAGVVIGCFIVYLNIIYR